MNKETILESQVIKKEIDTSRVLIREKVKIKINTIKRKIVNIEVVLV